MSDKLDNKHVVPRKEGWGVIDADGKKASKVFPTKSEALAYAKDLAKRHNVFMVVHDEDGKFSKFDRNPEVKDQHVVFKDKKWAVLEEGGEVITKAFDNKGQAMAFAYDLATKHNVCMLVHGKDGQFDSVSCSPDSSPGILQVVRMKLKI